MEEVSPDEGKGKGDLQEAGKNVLLVWDPGAPEMSMRGTKVKAGHHGGSCALYKVLARLVSPRSLTTACRVMEAGGMPSRAQQSPFLDGSQRHPVARPTSIATVPSAWLWPSQDPEDSLPESLPPAALLEPLMGGSRRVSTARQIRPKGQRNGRTQRYFGPKGY